MKLTVYNIQCIYPSDVQGKSMSEKNVLAGEKWRSLSDSEKLKYQDVASATLSTQDYKLKSDDEFKRIIRNLKENVHVHIIQCDYL